MSRAIDAIELEHRMCELCNNKYSDEPCEPSDCIFLNVVRNSPALTLSNEPLSIEQLREMEGEPVYIHSDIFPEDCGWRVIAQSDVLRVYFTDGTSLSLTDYEKSWLSYRRPLEGGE